MYGMEGTSGVNGLPRRGAGAAAARRARRQAVAAFATGMLAVGGVIGALVPAGAAVAAGRSIATVAGNGTTALLDGPQGVAVDSAGNLYIADTAHNSVDVMPATTGTLLGQSVTKGALATILTGLAAPDAVAVDADGNLYVANSDANDVIKVSARGAQSVFAGQAMNWGSSGDAGPATSAKLGMPSGLAVDAAGDVFISDMDNQAVREVAARNSMQFIQSMTAGDIYTVLRGVPGAAGLAVDGTGDLYVAEYQDMGNKILKLAAGTSVPTTFAGTGTGGYSGDNGPATSAQLDWPFGVAADSAGDVYISDTWNDCVRRVDPSGIITTVAGTCVFGSGAGLPANYDGDGSPATLYKVSSPAALAVDASGNLFIADQGNNRIRELPVPATAVTGFTLNTGSSTAGASSSWTIGFNATSGLSVGGSVYLNAPSGTVFPSAAADFTINGSAASAVYGGGTDSVALTLGDSVASSGPMTVAATGVTNPAAGSYTDFSISTTTDSQPAILANPLTFTAPTTSVSNVTLKPSSATPDASSTWTVGFTASSGLSVGQAVYLDAPVGTVFSSTYSDYTINGSVASAVYGGQHDVSLVIGSGTLPVPTGGSVTVVARHTTNPAAGTFDFSVFTSLDQTPVSTPHPVSFEAPAVGKVIFTPGSLVGGASTTWTVSFTATSGLTVGDAVYLYAPTGTIFSPVYSDYTINGTVAGAVYGANGNIGLIPPSGFSPITGGTVTVIAKNTVNPPAGSYTEAFGAATRIDSAPAFMSTSLAFTSRPSGSGNGTGNNGSSGTNNGAGNNGNTTTTPSSTSGSTFQSSRLGSLASGTAAPTAIALQNAITSGGGTALIQIRPTNGQANLELSSDALNAFTTTQGTLQVQVGSATISLPSTDIAPATLAANPVLRGVNLANAQVNLGIQVTTPPAAMATPVAGSSGTVTALSQVYSFDLQVTTSTGQTVTLENFLKPIVVQMPYVPTSSTDPELLGAYRLDANGGAPTYVGGTADPATDTVSVGLTHFSQYVVLQFQPQFTDVPAWAAHDVAVAAAHFITNGITPTEFAPSQPLTRAAFVSMIARALGLQTSTSPTAFRDVSASAWYAGTVSAAVRAGLVTGTSPRTFDPNGNITREQMAVLLERAAGYRGDNTVLAPTDLNSALARFSDSSSLAPWAYTATAYAIHAHLIRGESPTALDPLAVAGRVQAAVVLVRFLFGSNGN